MRLLAAILLALALALAAPAALAPLPLQLERGGHLVAISWPPIPGQASADITVWRADATVLIHQAGAGTAAQVVASCGDRLQVAVWSAAPRLLAVADARAPCAVWLPVVQT